MRQVEGKGGVAKKILLGSGEGLNPWFTSGGRPKFDTQKKSAEGPLPLSCLGNQFASRWSGEPDLKKKKGDSTFSNSGDWDASETLNIGRGSGKIIRSKKRVHVSLH